MKEKLHTLLPSCEFFTLFPLFTLVNKLSTCNLPCKLVFVFLFFIQFEIIQAQPALKQAEASPYLIDASDTAFLPEPGFYKGIRESAAKRSWTRQLHSFVFREPAQPMSVASEGSVDLAYRKYSGKIIQSIKIIVLTPFGTNIMNADTCTSTNWFDKTGNKLHVNTQQYIVRNNLLFKLGERVNPLNIAESEALLRRTSFINDVIISMDSIPTSDKVNITVILRDNWSIGVNLRSFSPNSFDVEMFDRNFIGTGSNLSARILYKHNFYGHWGYGLAYFYRSIEGSFIDFRSSYINRISEREANIAFERMLQPTIKYFGEISFSDIKRFTDIVPWDSVTPVSTHILSGTLGRAFNISSPDYGRRMTVAVRYMERRPTYPDNFLKDTLPYNNFENRFVLLQWSIFRQRFYRENMLNSFGIVENIALGYNFSTQIGYSQWPGVNEGIYASFSAAKGKGFLFGNYFMQASISSFFNKHGAFQGVLNVNGRYFTPLLTLGRGRFRQFVKIDYSKLLNPYPQFVNNLYYSTLTHLNTSHSNTYLYGFERLMLSAESNFFTPLYLAGFRYMFYTFQDLGWIGSGKILLQSNNLTWGVGLGIRVRNDLLVFRTLDIKLGWYPNLNQTGFKHIVNASTSELRISPNFAPGYPQEIALY